MPRTHSFQGATQDASAFCKDAHIEGDCVLRHNTMCISRYTNLISRDHKYQLMKQQLYLTVTLEFKLKCPRALIQVGNTIFPFCPLHSHSPSCLYLSAAGALARGKDDSID